MTENEQNNPVSDIQGVGGSIGLEDGAILNTLDKMFKKMKLKYQVKPTDNFIRITMGKLEFWFVNKNGGVYDGWGYCNDEQISAQLKETK